MEAQMPDVWPGDFTMIRRQDANLEVAEWNILQLALGVTRLDKIRNEYIRGAAYVARFRHKLRERQLRWFGHEQRRDGRYAGKGEGD